MLPRKIIQTLLDDNDSLIEYLLEDDEEFTPKAEAVRLASSGEVDAIVVRPKKGAPYLRAKGDRTKNNNLRQLAVKRTCGPEIGIPLRDVLYRVKQIFEKPESKGGWSDKKKAELCNYLDRKIPSGGVNAANSWDIEELYDAGTGKTPLLIDYLGCAKVTGCKTTVMVFGRCHKSPIVNYILYGFLWRLAQTGYPLSVLRETNEFNKWVNKMVAESAPGLYTTDRYREEYYSLDNALLNTAIYKSFIVPEDRPMCLEWVDTGFHFDNWVKYPSRLTPRDDRFGKCGKCSVLVPKTYKFTVRWGTGTVT